MALRRIHKKNPFDRLMFILFLLFVFGVFIGCGSAEHSDIPQIDYTAELDEGNYTSALWRAAQFHIVVCVAAVCSAGVILIPVTIMLRGYFLACTSAVIGVQEPLAAWIICGLPAFLQLPSLFALSCAGMRLSALLHSKSISRRIAIGRVQFAKYIGWSIIGILLCAVADRYIAPLLLQYFINL